MSKVKDYKDAEREARKWIADKYPKAKDISFTKIWKEGDVWIIDGELEIKTGFFAIAKKPFKLQLSSETGEIIGYSK